MDTEKKDDQEIKTSDIFTRDQIHRIFLAYADAVYEDVEHDLVEVLKRVQASVSDDLQSLGGKLLSEGQARTLSDEQLALVVHATAGVNFLVMASDVQLCIQNVHGLRSRGKGFALTEVIGEELHASALAFYENQPADGQAKSAELKKFFEPHWTEIRNKLVELAGEDNEAFTLEWFAAATEPVLVNLIAEREAVKSLTGGDGLEKSNVVPEADNSQLRPTSVLRLFSEEELDHLTDISMRSSDEDLRPAILEFLRPIWSRLNASINAAMDRPEDVANSIDSLADMLTGAMRKIAQSAASDSNDRV